MDVVTTHVVHPWHAWDQEHQKIFMIVGNEVGIMAALF